MNGPLPAKLKFRENTDSDTHFHKKLLISKSH